MEKDTDKKYLRYGDVLEDGSIFTLFMNSKRNDYLRRCDFNDTYMRPGQRKRADGTEKALRSITITRALCSLLGWTAVHSGVNSIGDILLHYLTSRPLGPENIPFMLEILNHQLKTVSLPSHFQLGVNLLQIKTALDWVATEPCWTKYSTPQTPHIFQDREWIGHLMSTLKATVGTTDKNYL
jgi:hypothetical protein